MTSKAFHAIFTSRIMFNLRIVRVRFCGGWGAILIEKNPSVLFELVTNNSNNVLCSSQQESKAVI